METIALASKAFRTLLAGAVAPAPLTAMAGPGDFDPRAYGVGVCLYRVAPPFGRIQGVTLHYLTLFGGDPEQGEPERLYEAVYTAARDHPILTVASQHVSIVQTVLTVDEMLQLQGGRPVFSAAWQLTGLVLTSAS